MSSRRNSDQKNKASKETSPLSIILKALELIVNNKMASACITAIFALAAYYSEPLKESIYSKIWPNKIIISHLEMPSNPCSGCTINFRINIAQASESKIEKGVIEFELKDGLKIVSKATIETPEFKGMHTTDPVTITIPSKFSGESLMKVIYKNNQIKQILEIKVYVTPQKNCLGPKIVTTDTNRVNLTGEWNIDLGADHGTMTIEQQENNKIKGSYSFENNQNGAISGYKDGTVFNVFFQKRDELLKRIRIESAFEINKNDAGYIEIKGCAYGIQKNESVKSDTESSKYGSCTKLKSYVGWKGISISDFYATSMIKNCYD
jgi:hypothetical protein